MTVEGYFPSSAPGCDRLHFSPDGPSAVRLSADESVELRAALVARGARLADMLAAVPEWAGATAERVRASKAAVDSLIGRVDDLRVLT